MNDSKDTFLVILQKALGRLTHLSLCGIWRYAREKGFSMTQVVAMHQIYYRNDYNISDISRELGVTHAASSQMLDRLVQQGYVTRSENPQDRRNKRIVLTEKGDVILRDSMQASQKWLVALFDRLTPEEAKTIIAAMNILIEKTAGLDEHSSPNG
jgi:DNA-binding MarR family transcriptional regulator